MKAKRLEDILEECINAGVEGRRTVEQSLSLYPAYAEELEPLLRAALRISDEFHACSAAPALQQRGLHRFLAAANDRRRVRQLTSGFERRGWLAGLFRNPALAGMAATAAVVVVTVAVAGGVMLSGGDDEIGGASVVNPPATNPTDALTVLRTKVDATKDKALTGSITAQDPDLAEVQRLIEELRSQIERGTSPEGAAQTIAEIDALLQQIVIANPDLANDSVVMEIEESTRNIANVLPGGATPAAATQPVTPTAVPATDPPTVAPTPAPTDPPTAAPTATPAPTGPPAPTETADARDPQGLSD